MGEAGDFVTKFVLDIKTKVLTIQLLTQWS